MPFGIADTVPKFYGSVTVGERGQIAIPAEARREMEIVHSSKLLVFGGPSAKALIFVKAEAMAEFLQAFTGAIRDVEQAMRSDKAESKETEEPAK